MRSLKNCGNSIRIGRKVKGEKPAPGSTRGRKAKERVKIKDGKAKLVLLIFLILFPFFRLSPFAFRLQSQSFTDKIYQSYISGDMDRWERLLKENNGKMYKPEDRYNYALACYGFIGYMIGEDEKPRSKPYLNRAEGTVDSLLMENPDVPKYMALRCALYGFRSEYQPGKIASLLPKGMRLMSEAEKSGADSPQVWLEMGNRDWFLPVSLGGSDLKAIEEYKKAIAMMEALPGFTRNNWYYLKAYKILIGWYEKLNFRFQATETCRKLLTIEPDFIWARRELNILTGITIIRKPDGP